MQKEFEKHMAEVVQVYELAKEKMLRIEVSSKDTVHQNELFTAIQGLKEMALGALIRENKTRELMNNSLNPGIKQINDESYRIDNEFGFNAEHDQKYLQGELLYAAQAYMESGTFEDGPNYPSIWPFPADQWKPTTHNRIRELVKAGTFIVSEINRLDFYEKAGYQKEVSNEI